MAETLDARKQRFGPGDLESLLQGATKVIGAKGKRVIEIELSGSMDGETRAELEKLLIGPSGNLRAPAARAGSTFLVGFQEGMWSTVFA